MAPLNLTHNTNLQGEALGRLRAKFQGVVDNTVMVGSDPVVVGPSPVVVGPVVYKTPILHAIVIAASIEAQLIEDTLWTIYTLRSIATSQGAQLDGIGRILGQPRGGYADAQYQGILYLRVMEINSEGTPPQMIQIYSTLFGGAPVNYAEKYPAFFEVTAVGGSPIIPLSQVPSVMDVAHSAGVGRGLIWAPLPQGTFQLDSGPANTGLGGDFASGQNTGRGGQFAGDIG